MIYLPLYVSSNYNVKFSPNISIIFWLIYNFHIEINILIKLSDTNILESLNIAKNIINNKEFNNQNIIDLRIPNYIITSNE